MKEITSACDTSPVSSPEPAERQRSFKNCCDRGMQTQYEQYVFGAEVETMILRNQTVVQESGECISNRVNMLDLSVVLKKQTKKKFSQGFFPNSLKRCLRFLALPSSI